MADPRQYTVQVTSGGDNVTITVDPTPFIYKQTVLITIQAKDGYFIDKAPWLYVAATYDDAGGWVSPDFTLSEDKKTATYSLYCGEQIRPSSDNVPATGTDVFKLFDAFAVADGATPVDRGKVTKNLTNCVASGSLATKDTFTSGRYYYILLTANEGYSFKTKPTVTWWNIGGLLPTTAKVNLSNDGKTAWAMFYVYGRGAAEIADLSRDLVIEAKAVSDTPQPTTSYKVTKELTNCTATGVGDSVETGATYNITLQATSGYSFQDTPTLKYYGDSYVVADTLNFTLSSDKKTATLTVTFGELNPDYNVTITGVAVSDTPVTPTEDKRKITKVLDSCTLSGANEDDTLTVGNSYTLVLTAQTGYIFTTKPVFRYRPKGSIFESVLRFTIADDSKSASLTWKVPSLEPDTGFTIVATATTGTSYDDIYGAINVYKLTPPQVSEVMAYRYGQNDLTQFIAKLHRVLYDIGETFDNTVSLGNVPLEDVTGKTPYNSVFTLDFGTVTIEKANGNAVDTEGDIKVYLPFRGFESIETDSAIGHKVGVVYRCDVVTGKAVIYINIDGVTVKTIDTEVQQDVTYRTGANTYYNTVDTPVLLYDLQPYVLQTTYTSSGEQPYQANQVRDVIGNFSGYNEFTDIEGLTGVATSDEYNLIVENLKAGVII